MISRAAFFLIAAISFSHAAKAQVAFEPASVTYVVCVTDETRKFALQMPPLPKDAVIERAFHGCSEQEAQLRKALAEKGETPNAIDARLDRIKKFIAQSATTDIDRVRANVRPK